MRRLVAQFNSFYYHVANTCVQCLVKEEDFLGGNYVAVGYPCISVGMFPKRQGFTYCSSHCSHSATNASVKGWCKRLLANPFMGCRAFMQTVYTSEYYTEDRPA